jgi:hypothetical protein
MSKEGIKRRLEALNAVRKPWVPSSDMTSFYDAIMADCEATQAGRPYSHWSRPRDEPPAPMSDLVQRVIDQLETMAKRLREDPELAGL